MPARPGPAHVQERQADGAPDRGIRAEAGSEEAGSRVKPDGPGIWAGDDHQRRHRMRGRLHAVQIERRVQHGLDRGRDDDRKVARVRTRHHGIDGERLEGALAPERGHEPERLRPVGARTRQHRVDARAGGRDEGQPVAPLAPDELRVDVVLVELHGRARLLTAGAPELARACTLVRMRWPPRRAGPTSCSIA